MQIILLKVVLAYCVVAFLDLNAFKSYIKQLKTLKYLGSYPNAYLSIFQIEVYNAAQKLSPS